jgi:hypothetical protein
LLDSYRVKNSPTSSAETFQNQLQGISGFTLILRRVILARKTIVVSEYQFTIATSVALEIAATLEAILRGLFRRGKLPEYAFASLLLAA